MNKKFRSVIIIVISLIAFCSLLNDSYAYNQVYNAIITENDNEYSATIRQFSIANSQNILDYNNAVKDYDGWVNVSLCDLSQVQSLNNDFITYAFKFHKNISSIYNNGFLNIDDKNIINMYYDEVNIEDKNSMGRAINVDIGKSLSLQDDNSIIQTINGIDIYIKRYKVVTFGVQDNILITDYVISNALLQKLVLDSKYYASGSLESGNIDIRISNVLKTSSSDDLDTLAKLLSITGDNLSDCYKGFSEEDKSFLPISSIANLYDNIISIPTGNYYGREVYVRHFDSATGKLIDGIESNEQVIVDKNGEKSLIESEKSNISDFPYSEYYKYNNNYQMEISKSLVINADGKKYSFLGANISTVNTIEEAKYIINQKGSNYSNTYDIINANTITTKISNSDDITVVDFYYSVTDTKDVQAKIGSNTNIYTNSDTLTDCSTTYIPSGEYLKPYIIAPKYILKDLKYKKVNENGSIVYAIDKFSVYKLCGGTIKNSFGIEENGKLITGNIIGNTNSTLINGYTDDILLEFTENQAIDYKQIKEFSTDSAIEALFESSSTANDFNTSLQVSEDKINGLRYLKGEAVYNEYNVLENTEEYAFKIETQNKHFVNVYTPITLNSPIVTSNTTNHTDTTDDIVVINEGDEFTIDIPCSSSDFAYYQNMSNTSKYVSRYFVMFDFDILYNGEFKSKGELIEVTNYTENGATFTAKVYESQGLGGDDINATSKAIIFAVANNLPSEELLSEIVNIERKIEIEKDPAYLDSDRKYIKDTGSNLIAFNSICDGLGNIESSHPSNLINSTMYLDSFYVAKKVVTLKSASRIYDFRITDCNDLAFKNVFRESNNLSEKTNVSYFSGIRRLYIYNKAYQKIIDREDIDINGTKTSVILPLGPYKHSTATYINAPKLGYRISFDVKTAGYYISGGNNSKYIQITPSYYYISKDGQELIKDIDLYYKNENGKYQNFVNSNYTIYFKPNDAYRNIEYNDSNLSDKLEALNLAGTEGYFTLNDKMMTVSDSLYIQAWYGEFKLPNSTIAVKEGDNIRNKLKDGYIGVKFDIKSVESNSDGTTSISYNQNDKSVGEGNNTSQWDYEGYLGFSNIGKKVTEDNSLRLQLENGIWKIDNDDVYNFIKGTVVLYDIDNSAATDFE